MPHVSERRIFSLNLRDDALPRVQFPFCVPFIFVCFPTSFFKRYYFQPRSGQYPAKINFLFEIPTLLIRNVKKPYKCIQPLSSPLCSLTILHFMGVFTNAMGMPPAKHPIYLSFHESYGINDSPVERLLLSRYGDEQMDRATVFNSAWPCRPSAPRVPCLGRAGCPSRPQRSESWEEPAARHRCISPR